MRKFVAWLFVITMIAGSMSACGSKEKPTETTPPTAAPQETETIPEDTALPIGHEDTYWAAEAYDSEDGEGPLPIEPELWTLDLLIRIDGTACFRDIHEGICLEDRDLQAILASVTYSE